MQRALLQPDPDVLPAEGRDRHAFTAPDFTAAPYAGFGTYYLPPDTHPAVDLRSKFVAYDNTTLESPVPPASLDTPQAAYYYVYTGPETLKYSLAPCTQDDTLGAAPGTVATPGGGLWTKVIVGARRSSRTSPIWYAFYRTRLALIKSAASLAFSPLNDTKRVGFITVQPKDSPTIVRHQSDSFPAGRRFQFDPEERVVPEALPAAGRRRLASARRPGPGRPLLRRPAGRHQHQHAGDRR